MLCRAAPGSRHSQCISVLPAGRDPGSAHLSLHVYGHASSYRQKTAYQCQISPSPQTISDYFLIYISFLFATSNLLKSSFKKGYRPMKNLRLLRNQKDLSQQKLADILHISQQSVYKYEKGITTPDFQTLMRMADFFDTSIDYLIGYTDIPHKIEPVTEHKLNPDEEDLIQKYRSVPSSFRKAVQMVMDEYLGRPDH